MSIFKSPRPAGNTLGGGVQSGSFRDGALGQRGPYTPSFQQMRGLGAFGALGTSAAPGEIPWQCWGDSGFQSCHVTNFAQAQSDCANGEAAKYGMSVDDCVNSYSAGYDAQNCVPKYCGQYASIANTTKAMPVATAKKAQAALNADLKKYGFKTITVDGKLGPATCGAASYLYNSNPRQSTVWTDYNLYAYCGNSPLTNPTLVGSSAPLVSQVAATTTIVQGQAPTVAANPGWGVADPAVLALQKTLNQVLTANGMRPILLSGMLDAQTCGAMRWIKTNTGQDFAFGMGANCQAFADPVKETPKGAAPPTVAPPAPVPPGQKAGVSQASLVTGGIVMLLVGGGYYYAKKKGLV